MKNALLALGGGLVGCTLSVVLIMAGIVSPPARENQRGGLQSACAPDDSEQDKRLRALTDDNASLRSELRALRASQEVLDSDLRKMREASPKPVVAPPEPLREKPPVPTEASSAGFTDEDVRWMRLFVRGIKPMLYQQAAEQMRALLQKLRAIYQRQKTIAGTTLEMLWPEKDSKSSGRDFWHREDFAILAAGAANGEIELVGDPVTPRLKLFFDFEAGATISWNREIEGVTDAKNGTSTKPREGNIDQARASEARASAGALKDRARVVYARTSKAPQTLADLGVADTELTGFYFVAADYSVSGTAEEFVITVRNVYSDAPFDLVLTANIITGEAKFNR